MLRFLPWKFFVKYAAKRYGVLDPATLLARIRRFSQPSEIAEPLELLRAGIIFHARGLLNAKAIQHNLDWVWPYWVQRQFNPADRSFIPRAFSFSHINLTHRNWTAVGLPGIPVYPIIDPRGLLTALHDGWSLDFWILTESGRRLLPSQLPDETVSQQLQIDPSLVVSTRCIQDGMELELASEMIALPNGSAEAYTRINALSNENGWLAVAVRPYNPEGIQWVENIALDPSETQLIVNHEAIVKFGEPPDSLKMAHYAEGDVSLELSEKPNHRTIHCPIGMATAAALFRIHPGIRRTVGVSVSLDRELKGLPKITSADCSWPEALRGVAQLMIPDTRQQFLYNASVRTLLLLSAGELVPGPYTYRRFWFRDACLMLHPMLAIGLVQRVERILATFPGRQNHTGYFLSQEGEWDSNGQVLWIAARYTQLTGKRLGKEIELALRKGMRWLARKRDAASGLLPAGFSAEHLGPNDFYYWDDFWAWAGLREIGKYWRQVASQEPATEAETLAGEFACRIDASLKAIPAARSQGAIPAAPGRRMDAGAIGSMVADYPLQLYPPNEPRLAATVNYLINNCFYQGGFFQEMIHSGVNAYLTLDLAQTLLRAGDPRFAVLIRRVAELASPTGQWPEAIHPQTLGGCMGDGQHGWAAGEWIMMMRNCFVREEDGLVIIGSGILPEWLASGDEIGFGPTLTSWGTVNLRLTESQLILNANWRDAPPRLQITVPGFKPIEADPFDDVFQLQKL